MWRSDLMRPTVKFLDDQLLETIVAQGRAIMCELGLEIHNDGILAMLADHGATVEAASRRAVFSQDMIDRALETAPRSFVLYDALGEPAVDLSGDKVHFTPGSAAINILDNDTGAIRPPTTIDYVRYAKLVSRLEHLASQSTAFIPQDVPERISDSY
ncbi:MAG: hypothetical protein GY778_11230, partial [bacterium]|nr:hypothetical protein [bacterium]